MGLILSEPAEQLGDTTPGALDTLPPLEEHPAVRAAREAMAPPRWMRWAVPAVVVLTLLCSAVWPMGWAPAPLLP